MTAGSDHPTIIISYLIYPEAALAREGNPRVSKVARGWDQLGTVNETLPFTEVFPSPKGSFCLVYWAVNLLEKVGLQLIKMQANNEQDPHLSRGLFRGCYCGIWKGSR